MKKRLFAVLCTACLLFCAYSQTPGGTALRVIPYTTVSQNDGKVSSLSFSKDGLSLLSAAGNSVCIYDAETLDEVSRTDSLSSDVLSARFSPDALSFLTVTEDSLITVCSTKTGNVTALVQPEQGALISDAVFLDDVWNIAAPADGTGVYECFILVMTNTMLKKKVCSHADTVFALDVDCMGTLLLSTGLDEQIKLARLKEKVEVASFPAYTASKVGAVFAPDGKSFISADKQDSLVLRDLSGAVLATYAVPEEPVSGISFSPDGKTIAVPAANGLVKVINVETGKVILSFRAPDTPEKSTVRALSTAFSPDGNFLFTGFENGLLVRWSLNSMVVAAVDGGNGSFEFIPMNSTGDEMYQLPYVPAVETPETLPSAVLSFSAGYSLVQQSYYTGSIDADVWFQKQIGKTGFMWGLETQIGISKPTDEYPYKYIFKDNTPLLTPRLYTILALASLSYSMNSNGNTRMYFGAVVGPAFRFLWNNNFERSVKTKMYPSFDVGIAGGVDFKGFTLTVAYIYNSQIGLQPSCQLGYSFHFTSGGRKNEEE